VAREYHFGFAICQFAAKGKTCLVEVRQYKYQSAREVGSLTLAMPFVSFIYLFIYLFIYSAGDKRY
jgi:hypothetical protein